MNVMKLKMFFFILAAILIGLIAWHFFSSSPKIPTSPTETIHDHDENFVPLSKDQIMQLEIDTKIAEPGELSINISTRGKIVLQPDKLAHILPKISGVAKETFKNIGDDVEEGEVLAIMESREIADIKANYLATKEKERLALSLVEREQRLFEKKVSAEQDYLNAKSAYQETKINVQLAEQKLHAFGIEIAEINKLFSEQGPDLRFYQIKSPMEGVVIGRHITKGEFIENITTIYEIADLSTIWIEIGIYPKDLAYVKEGQMVDVYLPVDGQQSEAKIIYLSPIIQDETITAKAIAEMKNPNKNWRPGSFVKIDIKTEKIRVSELISKEAIQEIDGKSFIFIKVPEGFQKRQVQLGRSDIENVEVLSGLNQGEEYAASNTFILKADLGKKQAEHDH